jgi:hypothetical protein
MVFVPLTLFLDALAVSIAVGMNVMSVFPAAEVKDSENSESLLGMIPPRAESVVLDTKIARPQL